MSAANAAANSAFIASDATLVSAASVSDGPASASADFPFAPIVLVGDHQHYHHQHQHHQHHQHRHPHQSLHVNSNSNNNDHADSSTAPVSLEAALDLDATAPLLFASDDDFYAFRRLQRERRAAEKSAADRRALEKSALGLRRAQARDGVLDALRELRAHAAAVVDAVGKWRAALGDRYGVGVW
jgi:hypothetical protein